MLPLARSSSFSLPLPLPASLSSPYLHVHAQVTASVRGNLGDAQVVVDPSTKDWLKDRWQAASDMNGTPIKGLHFLKIVLSHK